MSATGSWATQVAIVAALRGSMAIAALLGTRAAGDTGVYDEVPQGKPFPFIVVGEGTETDASYFGQVAHSVFPEVNIWTADGESGSGDTSAAGYKTGLAIAELVVAALLADGFTVTGHDTIVYPLEELSKERYVNEESGVNARLVSPKFSMLLEDSTP